jgi:hypothetical protein
VRSEPPKFSLTIHPPEHGWLRVDLGFADQSHSFLVSYVGDALVPLIQAATQIAERRGQSGPTFITFDWQDEPGAWRWQLAPEGDTLIVTIDHLPTTFPHRSARGGDPVLQWRIPSRRFCSSVLRGMDRLLGSIDERALAEQWRAEHARMPLERLRAALREW